MGLPPGIDLDGFKRYLGEQRAHDDSFLTLLLEGCVAFAVGAPGQIVADRILFDGGQLGRLLWPLPERSEAAPIVHTVDLDGGSWARVPDAREITLVEADGVAVTNYRPVVHRGGTIVKLALRAPAEQIRITGRYGFERAPEALRDAIYVHAARAEKERDAVYGDTVTRGDGTFSYFRAMPLRVREVYDSFVVDTDVRGLG